MTRRRKRQLTEEERLLWEAVKKTATPLRADPKFEPVAHLETPKVPKTPKLSHKKLPLFDIGSKAAREPRGHSFAPTVKEQLSKTPLNMDRKKYGRMQRGKVAPEARIDLHGMTVAEAHPALLNFIVSSHTRGMRLVLVITGKGKVKDDGGPIPVRTGVLKNQLPHWLNSAPLRPLVLQVSEAHISHGGSGAFYVYLRR